MVQDKVSLKIYDFLGEKVDDWPDDPALQALIDQIHAALDTGQAVELDFAGVKFASFDWTIASLYKQYQPETVETVTFVNLLPKIEREINRLKKTWSYYYYPGEVSMDPEMQAHYNNTINILSGFKNLSREQAEALVQKHGVYNHYHSIYRRMNICHEEPYYWAMSAFYADTNPNWWVDERLWPIPKEAHQFYTEVEPRDDLAPYDALIDKFGVLINPQFEDIRFELKNGSKIVLLSNGKDAFLCYFEIQDATIMQIYLAADPTEDRVENNLIEYKLKNGESFQHLYSKSLHLMKGIDAIGYALQYNTRSGWLQWEAVVPANWDDYLILAQ
jgi:hypothetical protein